ncbi:hypothetical protein CDEST_06890 [Colletotrichum destructivum]|uniref:Uncharacterized protein n=1 Tax=Colletotrichum destructivum TaxID=34406 RepID=A0AAX4IET2_9PEZI|nr:hypothetical protein CDEST_06890 [Colletotrichum destructivum]
MPSDREQHRSTNGPAETRLTSTISLKATMTTGKRQVTALPYTAVPNIHTRIPCLSPNSCRYREQQPPTSFDHPRNPTFLCRKQTDHAYIKQNPNAYATKQTWL